MLIIVFGGNEFFGCVFFVVVVFGVFVGCNFFGLILILFFVVLRMCVVIFCVDFIEKWEVYVLIIIGKFIFVMIVYLFLWFFNNEFVWLNGVFFYRLIKNSILFWLLNDVMVFCIFVFILLGFLLGINVIVFIFFCLLKIIVLDCKIFLVNLLWFVRIIFIIFIFFV